MDTSRPENARAVHAAADAIGAKLPRVAPLQQVIDRRTGETWTAVEWTGDLALMVRRLTPGHNSTCFNYAALPWRDVIPAGRARAGRR